MKKTITCLPLIFMSLFVKAQFEFDLSNFISSTESVSLNIKKKIFIKNMALAPTFTYSYKIEVDEQAIPPFNAAGLAGAPCVSIPLDPKNVIYMAEKAKLKNEQDERQIAGLIIKLSDAIKDLNPATNQPCIDEGNELIKKTKFEQDLLLDINPNQTITITVTRKSNVAGSKDITWTKVFKTPEKTRWLTHYGLTYAPSFLTKTDNFFSKADTSIANRYTITKQNGDGPKPWENISATINFTYPFSGKDRGFDVGATAGFGLSAGLELSGQAGLSAIIGKNVIIGTGVVMMQKYKLKGEYKQGDIIKENLSFDALHRKVWLPEMFFTIGFRFGSNPFAKKTDTEESEPAKKSATTE